MTAPLHTINPAIPSQHKTIIVFGSARGGTSMVSGTLRELGVNMGEHAHPLKYEYDPFVELTTPQQVTDRINYYDSKYDIWGWKSLRSLFRTTEYSHKLRNPHFVIVLRSSYDILMSNLKHVQISPDLVVADVMEVFSEIGRFIQKTPYPLTLVGYEQAVAQPAAFVRDLADFAGIPADANLLNRAQAFLRTGDYTTVSADADQLAKQKAKIVFDNIYDSEVIKSGLLNKSIREISTSHQQLLAECQEAAKIIEQLTQQLDHVMAQSFANLPLEALTAQSAAPPADPLPAASDSEAAEAHKRTYVKSFSPINAEREQYYRDLRRAFAQTSLWRASQQRTMDNIAEKIERIRKITGSV